MAYVPVPKDLNKIKTKLALNLTKRQLICFSLAAAVGIPSYLSSRGTIGNSPALFLMIGLMLPFFFFAMYERDGLPLEKVLRNILRTRFLYPRVRPYQTENFYALLSGFKKEAKPIAEPEKKEKAPQEKSLTGKAACFPAESGRFPPPPSRPFPTGKCTGTACAGWPTIITRKP